MPHPAPARFTLPGRRTFWRLPRIDACETGHDPIDTPDPIDAIEFRIEQTGLTCKDREPLIGTRTRAAEVLNRRRGLSIAMIRRLHQHPGTAAEVLIRPSRKDDAA